MESLRGHLPSGDRDNTVAVHLRIHAGAIQQQRNVLFKAHLLVENSVPDVIVLVGIAVLILHHDLFQQTSFTIVIAMRAADPHAHLAGRIAAQHRALLHQRNLQTMPRCSNRRTHTRKTAAYDAKIDGMPHRLKRHIPFLPFALLCCNISTVTLIKSTPTCLKASSPINTVLPPKSSIITDLSKSHSTTTKKARPCGRAFKQLI